MGLVTMSERDLKRIQVLTDVLAGRRTVVSAAAVLALGVRQTFRLLSRYQDGGAGAVIHQARGRASNRQWNSGMREYAVELVRSKYADGGRSGGNDGLMEKVEDQTMNLSGLPPFPQPLEITKCGDFTHSHRTTTTRVTLTFLTGEHPCQF
jgi:hypothetical protein